VGGTYTVTVNDPTTPNSGNNITFSTDLLSSVGACSIVTNSSTSTSASATVTFNGPGECLIDANQAQSNQKQNPTVVGGFAEAPTIQQIIQVGS
jgi:hypothetical protein